VAVLSREVTYDGEECWLGDTIIILGFARTFYKRHRVLSLLRTIQKVLYFSGEKSNQTPNQNWRKATDCLTVEYSCRPILQWLIQMLNAISFHCLLIF